MWLQAGPRAQSAVTDAERCLAVQETRQALGVHVSGNVLIVDEAHNLVDAVNNAHSAQVSAAQMRAAHSQLSDYYQRFRTRLAAGAMVSLVAEYGSCNNAQSDCKARHADRSAGVKCAYWHGMVCRCGQLSST